MSKHINEVANALFEKKNELSQANKAATIIKESIDELELELIELLNNASLNQIRTDLATFSVKESIQPIAKDWDAIYKWVADNNAFQLLQRRLSTVPYREFIDMGEEIPGVESFNQVTIATRKR